jgi:hypothetical protein
MKQWTLALAALALVAGCASPPNTQFYTLDMSPGSNVEAMPVDVVIDRLRPAQALRRGQIMIKRSPTEIEYYAEHEWAADVEELVAHKLSAELPRKSSGAPVVYVSGDILTFEQIDGADGYRPHVRLALQFRLSSMRPYDEPLLEATYENSYREEPPVAPPTASVAVTAKAVVEAMSDRLAAMAPAIAADARKAVDIARERGLID